jgi:dipeptidyl aminopeptidase/acylaminoacyl peptidase
MRFLLAFVLAAALPALAQPIPVADLFRRPAYAEMKISPDGQRIAALVPVNGRQNLAIVQVSPRKAEPLSSYSTRDVVEFWWINDKRILFRTGSVGVRDFDARGGGLFAVDIDGTHLRMLAEGSDEVRGGALRTHLRTLFLVRRLPGNGDAIIAQEHVYEYERNYSGGIYRVDTRTGERQLLSQGAPDSGTYESWVVDAQGVPRVLTASSRGTTRVHYRAGPEAPWTRLREESVNKSTWSPLAMAEDGKSLVVSARDGDRSVLRLYDPATKSMGEILAAHPQVDLRGVMYDRDDRVLGTRFNADRPGVAWFDPAFARIQRAIESAFPDAATSLSWSDDRARLVVTTRSDVSPGAFYLYDVKAGRMEWLADRAPWIDPAKMAPMRAARYAARDGFSIPAYLTLPRGKEKALPMVVIVHGGPWVDGATWGFDREAQFFASRGYAVLQPNFRGTTRYGWKHFAASFGQWGGTMQDDIEDGVRWAVAEGIADPKRVCIYGASYGGYAAMMGLAKTPQVYRCGVNYLGVTDLDLYLDATWSDYAYSDFITYSVKEMVGDRTKWKDNSPVALAARIESPVLLAYGSSDRRVPIEHGTRMRAALERHGKKHQWMVMDGEGHGFRDPKSIEAYYGAVEKFLAEHIGKD